MMEAVKDHIPTRTISTAPKPNTNAMQFIKTGPADLYKSAEEQLKKTEVTKALRSQQSYEEEEWLNKLDNWKNSRRKRNEEVLERVIEVKKNEASDTRQPRRKSKTFTEMREDMSRRGRRYNLIVHDDANDDNLSDLGLGCHSKSESESVASDAGSSSSFKDDAGVSSSDDAPVCLMPAGNDDMSAGNNGLMSAGNNDLMSAGNNDLMSSGNNDLMSAGNNDLMSSPSSSDSVKQNSVGRPAVPGKDEPTLAGQHQTQEYTYDQAIEGYKLYAESNIGKKGSTERSEEELAVRNEVDENQRNGHSEKFDMLSNKIKKFSTGNLPSDFSRSAEVKRVFKRANKSFDKSQLKGCTIGEKLSFFQNQIVKDFKSSPDLRVDTAGNDSPSSTVSEKFNFKVDIKKRRSMFELSGQPEVGKQVLGNFRRDSFEPHSEIKRSQSTDFSVTCPDGFEPETKSDIELTKRYSEGYLIHTYIQKYSQSNEVLNRSDSSEMLHVASQQSHQVTEEDPDVLCAEAGMVSDFTKQLSSHCAPDETCDRSEAQEDADGFQMHDTSDDLESNDEALEMQETLEDVSRPKVLELSWNESMCPAVPPSVPPPPLPSDSESEDEQNASLADSKEDDMNSLHRVKKNLQKRRSNFLGTSPGLQEDIILEPPPNLEDILRQEVQIDRHNREKTLLGLPSLQNEAEQFSDTVSRSDSYQDGERKLAELDDLYNSFCGKRSLGDQRGMVSYEENASNSFAADQDDLCSDIKAQNPLAVLQQNKKLTYDSSSLFLTEVIGQTTYNDKSKVPLCDVNEISTSSKDYYPVRQHPKNEVIEDYQNSSDDEHLDYHKKLEELEAEMILHDQAMISRTFSHSSDNFPKDDQLKAHPQASISNQEHAAGRKALQKEPYEVKEFYTTPFTGEPCDAVSTSASHRVESSSQNKPQSQVENSRRLYQNAEKKETIPQNTSLGQNNNSNAQNNAFSRNDITSVSNGDFRNILDNKAPSPPNVKSLSAVPRFKVKQNDIWITRKKSEPQPKDFYKHWLMQEAEQRRIEQHYSRTASAKTAASNQNAPSSNYPAAFSQSRSYPPQKKTWEENNNCPVPSENGGSVYTGSRKGPANDLLQSDTKMHNNAPTPDRCSLSSQKSCQGLRDSQTSLSGSSLSDRDHPSPHKGQPSPIAQMPTPAPAPPAPSEDQRLLSVSGKKKCSHCGEELGRGAAMIIESLRLFYHIPCFKCCVCGVQLGNGMAGADVRVRNHKLHCHNCYSNDEGMKFSKV